MGERGRPVAALVNQLSHILFKIIGFIVGLAPMGDLGAVAFNLDKYGVGTLCQKSMLVVLFYVSCAIFAVGVLGLILRFAGFNIFKLFPICARNYWCVVTASSDAVLPQILHKMVRMGIKRLIGHSYRVFIQSGGLSHLSDAGSGVYRTGNKYGAVMYRLLIVLSISTLTSKRAHDVSGSAIVILAATLSAIAAIGLVLVLSVDWFMDIARAWTNLLGNCIGTWGIGKSEYCLR